jgi:TonB family protein
LYHFSKPIGLSLRISLSKQKAMKKNSAYPLLIALILLKINVHCQNSPSDITASNELLNIESAVLPSKNLDFIKQYGITISNAVRAKILGEAIAHSGPNLSTTNKVFNIPFGSLVETFKYYPKEATWAIKYKEQWGFVSAALIIPDQEIVQDSSTQRYDVPPKLLNGIQGDYPAEAKSEGICGKVYLRILISKTGCVDQALVIKGIPGLDKAAIEAVKKLKFKPAKYLGKPVATWINLPIPFEL